MAHLSIGTSTTLQCKGILGPFLKTDAADVLRCRQHTVRHLFNCNADREDQTCQVLLCLAFSAGNMAISVWQGIRLFSCQCLPVCVCRWGQGQAQHHGVPDSGVPEEPGHMALCHQLLLRLHSEDRRHCLVHPLPHQGSHMTVPVVPISQCSVCSLCRSPSNAPHGHP